MFLREIELTNFKCHTHLLMSFMDAMKPDVARKTTFMLGENGTGKSAFLKAIALVTAGSTALGEVLGNPDEWIRNGKSFCEIACTITTMDGEERKLKLRISRGQHLGDIISANQETLAQIDRAISRADRNYFAVAYGASRRLNRDDSNRFSSRGKLSPRSTNIQSLFNPDAALVSLSNWAMELDYSKRKSGVDIVRTALNDFLVENVKFKGIDRKKSKLIFTTPDGDVTLEQLSDGYQNVAAWVGDLMFNITNTFKDYKDPLNARGLLLIDEIDLHLHPKWQRQLHTFIKDKLPNFQIVATTHSPLTVQQAEEGELYALKREGSKVEVIPFIGDPSKMLIHQILMAPIFGLATDESLKTEEAKEKVRAVRLKPSATMKEKKSIEPYEQYLQDTPFNIRSNNLLSQTDVELLQTINDELGKRTEVVTVESNFAIKKAAVSLEQKKAIGKRMPIKRK